MRGSTFFLNNLGGLFFSTYIRVGSISLEFWLHSARSCWVYIIAGVKLWQRLVYASRFDIHNNKLILRETKFIKMKMMVYSHLLLTGMIINTEI